MDQTNRSAPSDPPAAEQSVEETVVNDARVILCSKHKNNLMLETCNACRCCSRLVGPDMARQLRIHGNLPRTSAITGPATRLLGRRSNEIDPTLVFSKEELDTASRMFSMGRFRKGHWEELVRDYLRCPKPQHKSLSQNLELEQALKILDNDGKVSNLNEYRDKLIRLGLDLRVAQRPFVLSVGVNTDLGMFGFRVAVRFE